MQCVRQRLLLLCMKRLQRICAWEVRNVVCRDMIRNLPTPGWWMVLQPWTSCHRRNHLQSHPHTFSTRWLKLMNTWFLPTLHFYAVSFSQLPVGFADNVILNIAIFLSLLLVIRQFLPDVHIQEIKFSFRHQRLILRRSSVTISRQAAGLTRAQWGTRRKKWHSAAFTSVPSKQCNGTIADMQVLFDNVHNRERYLLTMWLYVAQHDISHWDNFLSNHWF